ncbi:zinc phosphodiesterase ELAC protein 2-like [Gigantopelta aegis]|uniref:zinc phosphodiesterase ELAC protein 2-like n=1 Tax=Gigantopelta aegis TaxID=1735272 RepID=UPI001B88986E|nr:zinc phosphodiesterase ELAC protein 2-like [Gigantopelta aegis]
MLFKHCAPVFSANWLGRNRFALIEGLKFKTTRSTMPKNKTNCAKLKHIKYKEGRGGQFPTPSVIDVQVIGSGGRGTPQSVVIGTDHSNYLFNSGEGVQRISSEHKVRLSKVENIFFTHKSWKNIGGLLGLVLTLEGTNVPKVTIHGPTGVEDILKMVTAFADSKTSIQIDKKNADSLYFEDSAFRIDYVELHKHSGSDEDRVNSDTCLSDQTESDEPDKKKQKLDLEDVSIAYVCKAHPSARKIDFEKCVELGIEKPGPVIGKLKAGEIVTLENGTVIHPEQVLSPAGKPVNIIVIDCPSDSFLCAVESSGQLNQFDETNPALLVVHMTPNHIMTGPRYQKWMKSFGKSTEHLVLNETTSEVCHLGLYSMQAQLNLLHPQIYPLLPHFTMEDPPQDRDVLAVKACTNLKYQLRPHKGFSWDQCLKLDRAAYVQEATNLEGFSDLLADLKEKLDSEPTKTSAVYPEVVFLGTGSSIPSKRRNVSGILLHLSHDSCMFLDCGEGTAAQLYHYYGNQTDSILQKVKAVFVSHLHADHHMGLFSLVAERKRALQAAGLPFTPLHLLAPVQISKWLKFYGSQVQSLRDELNLIPLHHFSQRPIDSEQRERYEFILDHLGLSNFLPVTVYHCRNAFGVSIIHKDGWKLVYSGDTMPCDKLVRAGQDCDLLIHEATMEDDLEEEARLKTHSTTSQAINIGVKMRAKFVMLNHFSQRYAKIPVINDSLTGKVGIAFDNMRVRMCDLHLLPMFNPVLKALFAEEHAALEYKMNRRTMKKDLLRQQQVR